MNIKEVFKRKTILIALPILILLAAALIAIGITNAANSATEPETEQTFTEEGDGYYVWVRAVDHAGNKGPWSEAQRVWIETVAPTITIKTNSNTTWAQTGSVTVALQDSKSGLASGAKLKYGWSTSLDTAPSGYTTATIPSYTAGTTSAVSFTASASGLTGKYYLWVVPTTLADTAGNSQTTTAKSTGQFYFDNKGPTAPTISGGSTSWATTRTIKVDTDSTDEGIGTIANYEYYLASNSTAPTASTGATASLGSGVKSKVFNDQNYNGYYVYFRAVDGVGNAGAWSSAARVYVDTVSPTVTAKNASITMKQGERSDTFTSLFNTSWGGITTGTITYSPSSYSNLGQLPVGTHTITCTMSKNNGTSKSASMTVTVNSAKPAYTEVSWTTAGTYSWTAPAGVTRVRVALCGALASGVVLNNSSFGSLSSGGTARSGQGPSPFAEMCRTRGYVLGFDGVTSTETPNYGRRLG